MDSHEKEMSYTITSRTLSLTLDSLGRVVSLRHSDLSGSGYEFLSVASRPVGLWQMGLIRPVSYHDPLPPVVVPEMKYEGHEWFANREEYKADLELDSNDCAAPVIFLSKEGDSTLTLTWTITVPDGTATVTMLINGGDRERLEFHFQAKLPEAWAMKRATYPRIRGFGDLAQPNEDALLYPETWGVLRRNPLADQTNYSGQYPAHINWCQMLAWLHGDKGVYLGILDPDSNHTGIDMQYVAGADSVPLENDRRSLHMTADGPVPATFTTVERTPLEKRVEAGVEPAMQLRCHHWPAMTNEWRCPYPVVLQGFTGTWHDAALIHRAWATQQRWCRRGLLADRKDTSSALAGIDLWFSQYGFPPWSFESAPAWDFQKSMHALHEFFQMPFGIHWYQWHDFSWHSRFPAHTPPVEGFEEVLHELQERGIVVMPYCQGRLLYRDRPNLEAERTHASVEANGQPYLEKYTPQDDWPLALCPGDPWSREQWHEAARMLWQDYGVEGVYFDQITAMPPSLCYHAGHGHALGGGNQYWQGYDNALAAMAPMIQEDPTRFLSSELMADAFLDRIDLYLTFVPPLEDFVPLHPAIYGGYTTVMGRSTPEGILQNPQLFAICQGEQLLFGGQLGWLNDSILKYPAAAAYLRDLARLRSRLREFLHYGTLEAPLALAQDTRVSITFPPEFTGKGPVAIDRPAVRQTVWRGPNARLLVLLLNEAVTETQVQFQLPSAWPRGDWRLWRLADDTPETVAINNTVKLTIPGLSVYALASPEGKS